MKLLRVFAIVILSCATPLGCNNSSIIDKSSVDSEQELEKSNSDTELTPASETSNGMKEEKFSGTIVIDSSPDLLMRVAERVKVGSRMDVYETREQTDTLIFNVGGAQIQLGEKPNNYAISITVSEKISPPKNGISLNAQYTIGETNNNMGLWNQINLSPKIVGTDEPHYSAVNGTINIKYTVGNTTATFTAAMANAELGPDADPEFSISGSLSTDVTSFNCYVLEAPESSSTDIDTGADEDADGNGTEGSVAAFSGTPEHPFCKQYL